MKKEVIIVAIISVFICVLFILAFPSAVVVGERVEKYEDCIVDEYGMYPEELYRINGEFPDCL